MNERVGGGVRDDWQEFQYSKLFIKLSLPIFDIGKCNMCICLPLPRAHRVGYKYEYKYEYE